MPPGSQGNPSFASLPTELRKLILRKTNSDTLRSLHHAQAGGRSKITTLTNAKLQLAARRKLTAKVEEMYRVRLRKAFGTAIGALEYAVPRQNETANMRNLEAHGWKRARAGWLGEWHMTKKNKDGFSFDLHGDYYDIYDGFVMQCDVVSPLGNRWKLKKAKSWEQNQRIKYSLPYTLKPRNNQSNPDRKRRIESKVSSKVLRDEFRLR
jgi:hypothetical protein